MSIAPEVVFHSSFYKRVRLFGVNEKIAHSAYFGTYNQVKLFYVSNHGRAWPRAKS